MPRARRRPAGRAEPIERVRGGASAVVVATLALFPFGPAYLRHALSALVVLSRSVEAAAPYRIEVTPGNVNVPRGADQAITAKLHGFDAEQAGR